MDVSFSNLDVEIRPMTEDEVGIFYSIGRFSSLYALTTEVIRIWHLRYPEDLLVAVKHGVEVVGICIACKRLGLISGLSLKPYCSHGLKIQLTLLQDALLHLWGIPKEITVPRTMGSFMHSMECKHRWNVCLYSRESTRIVPLPFDCRGYIVQLTEGGYGGPFFLHLVTLDGIQKKLLIDATDKKPIVTLKLYCQNGLNVIGCGAITDNDGGYSIIGPVFAPDENVAKVILKLLILYLKSNNMSRIVLVYAIDRNETKRFLEDSSFFKHDSEWSRYSVKENYELFGSFSFDDMEQITFALSSLSFAML